MNELFRWKSTHNLLSDIDKFLPKKLNRGSINQETIKDDRLNYSIGDNHKSREQIQQQKRALGKFKDGQQEFKRQKSLYRKIMQRNNSMKLFKEEPQMKQNQLRYMKQNQLLMLQDNKLSEYSHQQNRQRRFKRKKLQSHLIQNDEICKIKNNPIIITNNNSNDITIYHNNKKKLQSIQTKQPQNSLKEQILMQQKIILEKSIQINKLKSTILQLNGQVKKKNEIIHNKQEQNKLIRYQSDCIKHHFSKLINYFHLNQNIGNRHEHGQHSLLESQIKEIENQILSLKNGIKYLQIQNLILKKVKSEVDIQKQTILRLQKSKQQLQKSVQLLKDLNNRKSKKIKQFMTQKSLKRTKTQFRQQPIFSEYSDNSLNLSLQDEKNLKTSETSQISVQNLNFIKLLNSNSKRQSRNYEKIIKI